jgi:hypothetical protein
LRATSVDASGCPLQFIAAFEISTEKLDKAQVKYSAIDKELLSCCTGMRHFRFLLEGGTFTIVNDHKPLTYTLARPCVDGQAVL